ncbi:hypothetical protein FGB62_102g012 [Gracilaria domingensis]|nr:hypothetical protein FGB62_102g012 [Gracilaria domingensis]
MVATRAPRNLRAVREDGRRRAAAAPHAAGVARGASERRAVRLAQAAAAARRQPRRRAARRARGAARGAAGRRARGGARRGRRAGGVRRRQRTVPPDADDKYATNERVRGVCCVLHSFATAPAFVACRRLSALTAGRGLRGQRVRRLLRGHPPRRRAGAAAPRRRRRRRRRLYQTLCSTLAQLWGSVDCAVCFGEIQTMGRARYLEGMESLGLYRRCKQGEEPRRRASCVQTRKDSLKRCSSPEGTRRGGDCSSFDGRRHYFSAQHSESRGTGEGAINRYDLVDVGAFLHLTHAPGTWKAEQEGLKRGRW